MIVSWPEEFDRWLADVDQAGGRLAEVTMAMLQALTDLLSRPTQPTATFAPVRQRTRHELWRVSHPYLNARLVCWFADNRNVLVLFFGFERSSGQAAFWAEAVEKSEALVDAWLRQASGEAADADGGGPPVTVFCKGNARVRRAATRANRADAVVRSRGIMAEADRAYAMGVAALRQAAMFTQDDIVREAAGVRATSASSAAGLPADFLLTTLNAYLQAVGGHARIRVVFDDGRDIELDLGNLR